MIDIEKLKAALALIRKVCQTHTCNKCPLYGITCVYHSVYVPKVWPVDEIGDKNNDR